MRQSIGRTDATRRQALLAAAGLALSLSSRALAQTDNNWTNAVSGNWIDPTRWSLGLYPNDGNPPGSTYRAIFAAAGPAYTVTLNSNITVSGLVLNSAGLTLAHTSGTLTLNGAADFTSGTFQLNGGTLAGGTLNLNGGGFSILNNANNRFRGVSINGAMSMASSGAQLRLADGLSFGASSALNVTAGSAKLVFENTQTVSGGTINFLNSGSLANVDAGVTLTLSPTTTIRGGGVTFGNKSVAGAANAIINQGLVSADRNGQSLTITADSFTNSGSIQAINGGSLTINNLQGNVGAAQATGPGSRLTLGGAYNISSPLSVDGATLSLNGAWTSTAGVVANNATINLGGSFATPSLGTFTRTGTTTVSITGQLNNTGSTLLLDSPSNSVALVGGTITGGTITTANGERFRQVSGNGTLSGVSVPGDVTIAGGTLTADNGTAFTGEVAIGAGTIQFPSGSSINTGTFRYTGVSSSLLRAVPSGTNASLTLGPGVTVHGGGGNLGSQAPDNTTIDNYGLISADLPGQVLTVYAFLNNHGTIQAVNGGELDCLYLQEVGNANVSGAGSTLALVGYPYSITNTINVSNGGRLVLGGQWSNNGLVNIDHGTVDLSGTFGPAAVSGIANNGGTVRVTGTLDARGQTFTVPADLNLSINYQLWSDTLNVPAGVTLAINGGSIAQSALTGGGSIIMAGGTVGGPQNGGPSFTIPGGLIIAGYGAVNGAGATQFTNSGTIRANVPGQTMTVGNNGFVNAGVIEAVDGGQVTMFGSGWSNNGLMRAGNGSTLTLNGFYSFANGTVETQGTGTVVLRGTVNNANSTLTATGHIVLDGPTILGGTVSVPSGALQFLPNSGNGVRFTGVQLNGAVELPNENFARSVLFQNGLSGTSVFHVPGPLVNFTFENSQTIGGATFAFDGATAPDRRMLINANQTVTFDPSVIVHGGGFRMGDPGIGGTTSTFINQGLISSEIPGQDVWIVPGTMTNQGTIQAINGGTLLIGDQGQARPWSNTGTLRVGAGSVLRLGGSFALGTTAIDNTGGTVELYGRLNNAGQTLTLDSPTRSMSLVGGRIAGGSVVVSNAALTIPSTGGGYFDGVALDGDVTANGPLTLLNGTSFTGAIHIGDGGRLDIGTMPATLPYTVSTGAIQFDGNTTYPILGADNLVLGPNVLVHGGNGQFGRTPNNSGGWTWVNQGRISADVPGKTIAVIGLDNFGTLEAVNGGTISVGGIFEPSSVLRAINGTFELMGGRASLVDSMERVNATVRFGGTIDNSDHALTMDAATSWVFKNGLRFKGGSVTVAPGANFTFGDATPSLGGIALENLTFNGDLVTSPPLVEVDIRSLALNGTLALRTPESKAVFVGDQSFNSGTIFFDASGGAGQRYLTLRGVGTNGAGLSTLTFGPGAVLHGGDGVIRLGWGSGALGTFINQGLVSADISGLTLAIEQQRFANMGTVEAINGGIIEYQGPPPLSGGDPWVLFNSGTLFAGAGSGLLLDALEADTTSILRFEIEGPESYGSLAANSIAFDGLLSVEFGGGFVPGPGQSYLLLQYQSGSGHFAAMDLPQLPNGLWWDTSGLYDGGTISIVPAPGVLAGLAGLLALSRRRRP